MPYTSQFPIIYSIPQTSSLLKHRTYPWIVSSPTKGINFSTRMESIVKRSHFWLFEVMKQPISSLKLFLCVYVFLCIHLHKQFCFFHLISICYFCSPSFPSCFTLQRQDTEHLEPCSGTEPQAWMTAGQHSRTASILGPLQKKKEPTNAEHKQQLTTWSHRISSTGRGEVWTQKQNYLFNC